MHRRTWLRPGWDPLTSWDPNDPALWPTISQRLLLRALLLEGAAAMTSWREWLSVRSLEHRGQGDEALLSTLYLAADRLALSPEIRSTLRTAYAHNWARNHAALGRVSDVLKRLDANGIPAVLLKGAALLLVYYKDVGARTMADVDLLVRESDLQRAAGVLDAAGWRPPPAGLPPAEVIPYLHAVPWAHSRGSSIDLHWRPFTTDCPAAAEARFWQRTELHESPFGPVRVPAAADLLMLMCFHGRKIDPQPTGHWVADAMRVITCADSPIDWGGVLEESCATGLLPPVRDALTYLKREVDAAIPEDFLGNAGKITTEPLDMRRYAFLQRSQVNARGLAEIVAAHWWRYSTVCRARGRSVTMTGFTRYYLTVKQWEWNARGKWWVPLGAVSSALRRLWFHGA